MKKNKIILIGFLLFIIFMSIKLFIGGFYFYDFFDEIIPIFVIVFIISAIMMTIPFCYRLINKKLNKEVEYKKYKRFCLINSIAIFILVSFPNFLTIINGPDPSDVTSIDPVSFSIQVIVLFFIVSIVYYFINIIFIKK